MKSELNDTFKIRSIFWQLSSTIQWLLRSLLRYDWMFLLCCSVSHTQRLWPVIWSINSDLQNTNLVERLLMKLQSISPLPLKPPEKKKEKEKTKCKQGRKNSAGHWGKNKKDASKQKLRTSATHTHHLLKQPFLFIFFSFLFFFVVWLLGFLLI